MLVHFCFGMTPDFGGRPFGFSHYLSVRSAWEVLKPSAMVMHFCHEPGGEWWERARPMLQLHRVRAVEGIYGFPASHPAHRADIVRLAALIAMGGVYLDTDVLVVRPFDAVGVADFAAAWEKTAEGQMVGLSNAVLVARRGAGFARLCLEGHDPLRSLWSGFRAKGRDHNYVEMSVRYPAMLAGLCPTMLSALPQETFLWADWSDGGLAKLFVEDGELREEVLALHLWESHAWAKYLSRLTPERVRNEETRFHRVARRFLPDLPCWDGPGDQALPLDFAEMDAICAEVDFVDSKHKSAWIGTRVNRFFRAFRDEWNVPLRAELAKVRNELQVAEEVSGALPPASENASRSAEPNGRVARFGIYDGSATILERHLPDGGFSALILTENGIEPGACEVLMKNPRLQCLWVCGDLKRAHQISKWIQPTGISGRCLFVANLDSAEELKKVFEGVPDLFVDARWSGADWVWKGEECPKWILRCAADALHSREEIEVHGFTLLESSWDGGFALYSRSKGGGGGLRKFERVLSIYGDEVVVDDCGS
jgi:hypothetical protein